MPKKPAKQMELWELIKKGPVFVDELPESLRGTCNYSYKKLIERGFPLEAFTYRESGIRGSGTKLGIQPFKILFKEGCEFEAYRRIEERYPIIADYKGKYRHFSSLLGGHIKKRSRGLVKYIE